MPFYWGFFLVSSLYNSFSLFDNLTQSVQSIRLKPDLKYLSLQAFFSEDLNRSPIEPANQSEGHFNKLVLCIILQECIVGNLFSIPCSGFFRSLFVWLVYRSLTNLASSHTEIHTFEIQSHWNSYTFWSYWIYLFVPSTQEHSILIWATFWPLDYTTLCCEFDRKIHSFNWWFPGVSIHSVLGLWTVRISWRNFILWTLISYRI